MTGLSPHGLATLLFAAAVFAVFVWDRLPLATVSLAVLALLPLGFALFPLHDAGGTLEITRFFAGFASPALVAICALMVVGQGLIVTGALEPFARWMAVWVARSPKLALMMVLVGAASVSGVVNDTPVVVLLIPLLLAAAHRAHASATTMLLPMNYAVLIGGMATTIGTSTNLIVVGLAESLGLPRMGMFDHFPLVAMAAAPALLYLWLLAPLLLSKAGTPAEERLSEEVFDAELHISEGSEFAGKQLREALTIIGGSRQLIDLRRGANALARLPSVKLQGGDRLVIRDTAPRLKELEARLDARLHQVSDKPEEEPEPAPGPRVAATAVAAQLLITPQSPLVGRSVRQERLAERYDIVVVGMRPRSETVGWQRNGLAEHRVLAGDILLVQGEVAAIKQAQRDGVGLLLDERFTLPRQRKAPIALLTMASVVLLAATKTLPIELAALCGAVVLLLTRCLSWQDVAQSQSAKIILLVAASLALGDALQTTGAIDWLAHLLARLAQGLPSLWVMAALMGLVGLVTNFVSNNAAAAIGTPLGLSLAQALGAAPEPFVLAVLFGCNLCYLTPMGYQTNLLVMNAGGYRFGDFLRVGAPLFVIMWVGLTFALSWRYGL